MKNLQVSYRVRVHAGHEQRQARRQVADELEEDFARVLFTLVVAHDGNLNLLLVPEELVVRHFARQEGIGLQAYGFVQQEGTRSAAQRHRLYGPPQQFVVLQALDVEHVLDALQEGQRVLGRRQVAQQSAPGRHTAVAHRHLVRLHHPHVHQSQLLRNAVVHAVLGVVQVGVGCIDGDVVLYGHSDAALHLRPLRHPPQGAEQEGMMTDYEVASQVDGLADDLFGHIQTQQCP